MHLGNYQYLANLRTKHYPPPWNRVMRLKQEQRPQPVYDRVNKLTRENLAILSGSF